MLDKALKYSTLITGFLIFLGLVYLHFYYASFGIPIEGYITLSEGLLAFLSLIFLLPFFLVPNLLLSYLRTKKKDIVEERSINIKLYKTKCFGKRLLLHLDQNFMTISLGLSLGLVYYVRSFFGGDPEVWIFVLIYFAIVLVIVVLRKELLIKHKFLTGKSASPELVNTMIFGIAFFLIIGFIAQHDASQIISGNSTTTFKATLKEKGEEYSSEGYDLIGKTEKYLFIFNRKETSNIIIPVSELKKLEIKN